MLEGHLDDRHMQNSSASVLKPSLVDKTVLHCSSGKTCYRRNVKSASRNRKEENVYVHSVSVLLEIVLFCLK